MIYNNKSVPEKIHKELNFMPASNITDGLKNKFTILLETYKCFRRCILFATQPRSAKLLTYSVTNAPTLFNAFRCSKPSIHKVKERIAMMTLPQY